MDTWNKMMGAAMPSTLSAQQQANDYKRSMLLAQQQLQQAALIDKVTPHGTLGFLPTQIITPYGVKDLNPKPKKRSLMKLFRDYLEAHRDAIFTLILILLADHYVFKGAFAETIKAAFSKLLAQAHKKIDEKNGAKVGATL